MHEQLTLDNFEQLIDPTILERGRIYYDDDSVDDLEEELDGLWIATVFGTVEYTVEVEETDNGLICSCNCPYDWGPYCKHEVAVLYAIRAAKAGGQPSVKVSKKQQQTEPVRAVLEHLSQAQLINIIMEQVKKDKMLGNHLLLQYSENQPDKATYIRMIEDSLHAAQDRYGFIDYGSGRRAAQGAWELVKKARNLIDSEQGQKAIPMLQAVIETMTPALQQADDSNAELSGSISWAFEHLHDAPDSLDATGRRALFNYCLEEAFQPAYRDWDYCWEFLRLAQELYETPADRQELFAALDRIAETQNHHSTFHYEFAQETALQIKLEIMEGLDNPQAIHDFLRQHVHLNKARQRLVEIYSQQKEYTAACELCHEALKLYADKPGLVNDYYHRLLNIAEKIGDKEQVIRLAEILLVDSRDFDMYYRTLKKAIPPAEWTQFVKGLIQRIQTEQKDRWNTPHLLGEIYFQEQMWTDLLQLAQESWQDIPDRYRGHLEKQFPDEVCAIYEGIVLKGLKHTAQREHYQSMARYITRMKNLGRVDQANQLVESLKTTYPNRRAMIDELNRA